MFRVSRVLTIQTDNTGLIGLRNVGENAVDHADQHAVLERVARILDNGDDVCAVGGHVDEITAGSVGELDGEDGALGPDDISDVGDGGTRRSTEVQDLAAGSHVDVVHTAEDAGGQLASEGVPDAVFDAAGCVLAVCAAGRGTDADALLAVDALAGRQVLGHEQIFLAARDEDTRVPVRLDDDLAVEALELGVKF
jgi:hypothetical protein